MSEDFAFNFEDLNLEDKDLEFINNEETKTIEQPQGESVTDTIETEEIDDSSSQSSPSSDDNSSHNNSTLYALAKYLKDEGVLLVEEELKELDSLEDLKTLIAESNKKAKYSNMSESQRRYYDALENGIPVKDYEKIESEIQTFKGINDEAITGSEQLRYEIIAIDLINQGIEQNKAMKLAQLALKDESNVQDAKEALKNIIDFKTKQFTELLESRQEQTQLEIDQIKKGVFEKDALLTMKLNDTTKNKLFDLITTKVATDDNGMPMNKLQKWQRENPLESTILLNYLYLMTNEGKDLGLIKTNTSTTAAKELEKKLKELSFDKDGSLIIPDYYSTGSRNNSSSTNNKNLTINI